MKDLSESAKTLEVLMKFEGKQRWTEDTPVGSCWYENRPFESRIARKRFACSGKLKVFVSEDRYVVTCTAHKLSHSRWSLYDFKF